MSQPRWGTHFFRFPRIVRDDRITVQEFWSRALDRLPNADEAEALCLLREGYARFRDSFAAHTTLVLGAIQPVYELLEKLADHVGFEVQRLMVGHGGHEELEVLSDVWACSRGRLTTDRFLTRRGYHGPDEGDVSATVWRENPSPVDNLVQTYRNMADDADPVAAEHERIRQRKQAESEFLPAMPRSLRWAGRATLRIGNRYLPMRGVGKVALLQGLDVVRAATRRLGEHLVKTDALDRAEDVFMLRFDELAHHHPVAARARVAQRRPLYDYYRTVELPSLWLGNPHPAEATADADVGTIEGTAASPGAVEGPARVVNDPAESHVEAGEILVARDTDPSWASLMFASAGLVADIGGIMSHTAIVARELGIPCVVNTVAATRALQTGDIIRLNGSAGHIEVVHRTPNT